MMPSKHWYFCRCPPRTSPRSRCPARAARDSGYDVFVATAAGPAVAAVIDAGYEHREIRLTRSGQNPLTEPFSVLSMIRLFRSVRPDIVHLVTIKPVLYGGIAARLVGVPGVVSAISGLGTVFSSNGSIRSGMARFAARWMPTGSTTVEDPPL